MFYKIVNRKKKAFTMAADLAGYLLWAPFRGLRARGSFSGEGIREILVIRTAYLGDVVMTILTRPPQKVPRGKGLVFDLEVGGRGVRNNPYLDEIITYDPFWFYGTKTGYLSFIRPSERRYDLVIEARSDLRDLLFLVFSPAPGIKWVLPSGAAGFADARRALHRR